MPENETWYINGFFSWMPSCYCAITGIRFSSISIQYYYWALHIINVKEESLYEKEMKKMAHRISVSKRKRRISNRELKKAIYIICLNHPTPTSPFCLGGAAKPILDYLIDLLRVEANVEATWCEVYEAFWQLNAENRIAIVLSSAGEDGLVRVQLHHQDLRCYGVMRKFLIRILVALLFCLRKKD